MVKEFLERNRDCVILTPPQFHDYFLSLKQEHPNLSFALLSFEELKERFSGPLPHPEEGLEKHSVYIFAYDCGKEISSILGELHNMAVGYLPQKVGEEINREYATQKQSV